MRPLRIAPLSGFACLMLALSGDALTAQSVRSVSDRSPQLVPGGREVVLRVSGTGLSGVATARFVRNGREVAGIRADIRTAEGEVTLTLAAESGASPTGGIGVELGGPRMRRPLSVPVEIAIVAAPPSELGTPGSAGRPTGPPTREMATSPASAPAATDPSIQVSSLELTGPQQIYVGESRQGRIRITRTSRDPVQIEIAAAQPGSLQVPTSVTIPVGRTEATFQVQGLSPHYYLGQPWGFEVHARKAGFTSGPTELVVVAPRPAPEVAIFANDTGGDGFDFGGGSYGPPPPAFPATGGETRDLRVLLAAPPIAGGQLQLSASGPASVSATLTLAPHASDRVVSVPVRFPVVNSTGTAVVTVSAYGVSVSRSIEVRPDRVFVASALRENGGGTSAVVGGGDAIRIRIELSQNAGPGGYTVPVHASDPTAVSFSPVKVPSGTRVALLLVATQTTTSPRTVTLTIGDVEPKTFTITVQPSTE